MLDSNLIKHLEDIISLKITNSQPVSGGDISSAFLLYTENNTSFFLKVNHNSNALDMFKSEVFGLNTIASTNTIATPKVYACDLLSNKAYLLLEYIESKTPNEEDFKTFGKQLAELHSCYNDKFGLEQNNFIGSLPQSNSHHNGWLDFYTEERLKPQLELALSKGLLHKSEVPNASTIKANTLAYFQNIKPTLLHGDLWSGNYLISKSGEPHLIDPAVYYGHNEVDIAMTKLFGGFGSSFYNAYHEIIPPDKHTSNRIELYQLYYLLVHLNLFGSSYYSSVKRILQKYFID